MEEKYNFRKYKKKEGKKNVRHPKLIVDEFDSEYGFMGLTSRPMKGRGHKNIPLKKNPQKNKQEKSYLRRKIEYDEKKMFGDVMKNYVLSDEDYLALKQYVEKHKKKR